MLRHFNMNLSVGGLDINMRWDRTASLCIYEDFDLSAPDILMYGLSTNAA